MDTPNKTSLWETKQNLALSAGGKNKIDRQHAAGKNTARERLNLLLDTNSFQEIDQLATSPFALSPSENYTDGVVTGFGKINGQQVALYAQDFTVKGGSLGLRHAEKIVKVMDMAAKIGCPIIGIIDSGGARIEEGVHALTGYGKIFMRNSRYSGIVPQISIILGPCAGGAVYSPALTDFIFMTTDISQMFITGPQVIAHVAHETITKEALGGSNVHAHTSGVAHVVTHTEDACFQHVKTLLGYLPSNYLAKPQQLSNTQPSPTIDLQSLVPENESKGYDIRYLIQALCDNADFFEIHAAFAANIVVGFARLGGNSVGIVANQPLVKGGAIDIDASCKAARFIRFCDSFDIPIISLVDVPGYLPGVEQEHRGIIRHGAKLLYAYATATVPKITVILRKAFGGAFIAMGSKELGADFNFAWPQAQIAVLGAQAATSILHGKELTTLSEHDRLIAQQQFEADFAENFLNPFTAAQWGYIDAIVEPNDTRKHLIQALEITSQKVEHLPKRKHGNMPL